MGICYCDIDVSHLEFHMEDCKQRNLMMEIVWNSTGGGLLWTDNRVQINVISADWTFLPFCALNAIRSLSVDKRQLNRVILMLTTGWQCEVAHVWTRSRVPEASCAPVENDKCLIRWEPSIKQKTFSPTALYTLEEKNNWQKHWQNLTYHEWAHQRRQHYAKM